MTTVLDRAYLTIDRAAEAAGCSRETYIANHCRHMMLSWLTRREVDALAINLAAAMRHNKKEGRL